MGIVNIVTSGSLSQKADLLELSEMFGVFDYEPETFTGLVWKKMSEQRTSTEAERSFYLGYINQYSRTDRIACSFYIERNGCICMIYHDLSDDAYSQIMSN